MSECKVDCSDTYREDTEPHPGQSVTTQREDAQKISRGYSAMVFLRKGKPKKQLSRTNPLNTSKDLKESSKKLPTDVGTMPKKCEVMCFEEVSNDFTCSSAIMESYELNINKEAKYSFRKLEDGTFAMEKRDPDELKIDKDETGSRKRNSKTSHQKGRYAHRPLKICFKKRSKALRKHSDSKDDKSLSKSEVNTSNAEDLTDDKSIGNTWATFKRLVTRRKKMHSSIRRLSQLNSRHIETNQSNTYVQCVSKKKRFSNLRIPCMNFSRGKRSGHVNVQTEETLGVLKSSDPQAAKPRTDDERSDKALAIKYKLQQSIDAENGVCVGDLDQGTYRPKDQNRYTKTDDEFIKPQGTEDSLTQFQEQVLLCHSMETSEDKINGCQAGTYEINGDDSPPEAYNRNTTDQSYLTSLTDFNKASLVNHITNMAPLETDPYEILLMTTAASLVKKVIDSSIQQLVDEEHFHKYV
ncbi:A-kinase anchor protein 5 [Discoglossus pictus]